MVKQKADLLQGTLDMLILKALAAGAVHGYGVGQRIALLAEDMLTVEEENWRRLVVAVGKVLRTA